MPGISRNQNAESLDRLNMFWSWTTIFKLIRVTRSRTWRFIVKLKKLVQIYVTMQCIRISNRIDMRKKKSVITNLKLNQLLKDAFLTFSNIILKFICVTKLKENRAINLLGAPWMFKSWNPSIYWQTSYNILNLEPNHIIQGMINCYLNDIKIKAFDRLPW